MRSSFVLMIMPPRMDLSTRSLSMTVLPISEPAFFVDVSQHGQGAGAEDARDRTHVGVGRSDDFVAVADPLGHEGDDAYQRGVGVRKHVAGERRLLLGREARVLQRSVEICVAADGGDDLLRLVAEAQYAFRTALILHCFEKQRSVRGDLLFYDKAISCH